MRGRQFQRRRLDNVCTWHHQEKALSMRLAQTDLHASAAVGRCLGFRRRSGAMSAGVALATGCAFRRVPLC